MDDNKTSTELPPELDTSLAEHPVIPKAEDSRLANSTRGYLNRYIKEERLAITDYKDICPDSFASWLYAKKKISTKWKRNIRTGAQILIGAALPPLNASKGKKVTTKAKAKATKPSIAAFISTNHALIYNIAHPITSIRPATSLFDLTPAIRAELSFKVYVAIALTGLPIAQLAKTTVEGFYAPPDHTAITDLSNPEYYYGLTDSSSGPMKVHLLTAIPGARDENKLILYGLTDGQYHCLNTSIAFLSHVRKAFPKNNYLAIIRATMRTIQRCSGLTTTEIAVGFPKILNRIVIDAP